MICRENYGDCWRRNRFETRNVHVKQRWLMSTSRAQRSDGDRKSNEKSDLKSCLHDQTMIAMIALSAAVETYLKRRHISPQFMYFNIIPSVSFIVTFNYFCNHFHLVYLQYLYINHFLKSISYLRFLFFSQLFYVLKLAIGIMSTPNRHQNIIFFFIISSLLQNQK